MKKKITTIDLIKMKERGEKIVIRTAYDALFAEIEDQSGVEVILVGDSAGMVVAGYETTLPITMEEMLYHTRAVRRGVKRALLVADMPFLSFQLSPDDAVYNAGRFLKEGGAEAVKIEGGGRFIGIAKRLVETGIPVMGHLGLTPQSVHCFGGYGVRARRPSEADKLLVDAQALEEAGAFSIVLEKIPAELAKKVTESINIPTIGIGSGRYCDGQVLVVHDMLGIYDKFRPKFVRRYAELGQQIRKAVGQYVTDIKGGKFPSDEESY